MTRREDYLKLIYTLSQKGEVRGADLADELDIKRPTVCVYLKRLVENGDITMDRHHCVCLTEQGRSVAESTMNKHGMLCSLLCDLVCRIVLHQKMPAPLNIISARRAIRPLSSFCRKGRCLHKKRSKTNRLASFKTCLNLI